MSHPAIQKYAYHKWANDRILSHIEELPKEIYSRQIESVFSSIQEVIQHLYQADGMWLSVMSGDDFSASMGVIKQINNEMGDGEFAHMKQLYRKLNEKFHQFLQSHEDLDKKFTINHPKYGDLDASVTDMIDHVVNHGTYHRGNITAMLRQQGHAGVPTDYIFFLYGV